MPGTMTLKIITPEKIVLEQEVEEVTARALDGELSILPGHEPIVTALKLDVLRYVAHKEDEFVAVMGGILEVKGNQVTVLSDAAELDREIDQLRAQTAKERAEAERTRKTDKLDVYITEMAIGRATARLKALEFRETRKRRRS